MNTTTQSTTLIDAAEELAEVTPKRLAGYPAYRDSDIDSVGQIPTHWRTKPLKHMVRINSEDLPDRTDADFELQYIDISNVDYTAGVLSVQAYRFEDAPSRARRRVRDGDTIISTVRTYLKAIAKIESPPDNLIASTGFAVLRPCKELDPDFLYRMVQCEEFVGRVVASSVGVTYPAIAPTVLGRLYAWLPPLDEQRAIAGFLRRETAKIDGLVEKKRRLIELLREKRTALISHAVTKGLNPHAPMKPSGIELLGDVPAHWECKKLKYLGDSIIGLTYSPDDVVSEGCGTLVLRANNIQHDRITLDDNVYVTTPIPRKLVARKNDILLCSRNGSQALVGKSAMIHFCREDVSFGAFTTVFRSPLNPYLQHVFNSGLVTRYAGMCQTSTIFQLTSRIMNEFRIALPPEDERQAIVSYLAEVLPKIDSLVEKTKVAIARLNEHRSALISAAVTGKIDVRGEVCKELRNTGHHSSTKEG